MSVRGSLAAAAGKAVHAVLHGVLRRDASQLPGRVCLAIDPQAVVHLRRKVQQGSVVVCGTNGKTTTTNLVAAALEASGKRVLCNRAGANMLAGVTSALLARGKADWAVLEVDELSCAHVLPQLEPTYLVLLNLFRDQLDRTGEIDHVQDVLVESLASSPKTVLVVCGDDPLSWAVALRAKESGTQVLSFGVRDGMDIMRDRVPEARFCQTCGEELTYASHTYAQLGDYRCPSCGFARPRLDFFATEVRVGATGIRLTVTRDVFARPWQVALHSSLTGAYMAYNLTAVAAISQLAGIAEKSLRQVAEAANPHNGRQERFVAKRRNVLLNLAKNPTGMNQNIALLLGDQRQKAVFVVVNDNPNDGRDVSWIWDVDFELLAGRTDVGCVMCGGLRSHDLLVRLKYAGVGASFANGVDDALNQMAQLPVDCVLYVLTNYSALAPAEEELNRLAKSNE